MTDNQKTLAAAAILAAAVGVYLEMQRHEALHTGGATSATIRGAASANAPLSGPRGPESASAHVPTKPGVE